MNITLLPIGEGRQVSQAPGTYLGRGIDHHRVNISMPRQLPPHSLVASPRKNLLEKPFLFEFFHHTVVEKLLGFIFFRFRPGLRALVEDKLEHVGIDIGEPFDHVDLPTSTRQRRMY